MHTKDYFLTDDLTFKYVFRHEDVLKDFINSYFDYIGETIAFYVSSIDAQKLEFSSKRDKKNYYMDLVGTLSNGQIIDLEMYQSFNKRNFQKSCNYMARIYSNQIDINKDNYEDTKKVISLNLVYGNFRRKNKELINCYEFKNKLTDVILDDEMMELVLIRLDRVKKIPYTKHEKRFIRWLRIITSESLKEMEKYAEGDKIMENSIEFVKRYYESGMAHTLEDYARDKGYEMAKEAAKEATKETNFEIAKRLISMNLSDEQIIEATRISKDNLKALKKQKTKKYQ